MQWKEYVRIFFLSSSNFYQVTGQQEDVGEADSKPCDILGCSKLFCKNDGPSYKQIHRYADQAKADVNAGHIRIHIIDWIHQLGDCTAVILFRAVHSTKKGIQFDYINDFCHALINKKFPRRLKIYD